MWFLIYVHDEPMLCIEARASRPACRIAGMLMECPLYTSLRAERVQYDAEVYTPPAVGEAALRQLRAEYGIE